MHAEAAFTKYSMAMSHYILGAAECRPGAWPRYSEHIKAFAIECGYAKSIAEKGVLLIVVFFNCEKRVVPARECK